MKPDISIAIITFNHVEFIERALTSVIEQKTNLNIEILIGDDGSTDGTSDIVKRYEKKYPDKIKAFYHDRSQVIHVNGRPTAKHNYLNNLKHARGKYVAILDGDDYWIDVNKLQKQWDFMEQHPDCSTCFHAVEIFSDADKKSHIARPPKKRERYFLHDLIPDNFIHTSSVMFRHDRERDVPDWFYETTFGDWVQHLLRAQTGYLGYIDECMSTYRLHAGGRWSSYNTKNKIKESIEILEHFNRHTGYQYKNEITTAIQRFKYNLVLKLLDIGDVSEARLQLSKLRAQPRDERRISAIDSFYILACTKLPVINTLFTPVLKFLRSQV